MASLNKILIIGNVGGEPEMRFTPSGKAVTSFSVACNTKYGGVDTTEWLNIVAWDKLAETCNKYISKGKQVYVEGRLQTRKWSGQDGLAHYKTEVIASQVIFLGSKKQGEEETEQAGGLELDEIDF